MKPHALVRAAAGVACALILASCAAASEPPVRLVETRPVESTLGDPALPSAHDVWVEMIGGARKSLDLEEFYFSRWPGEPLDDVMAAIGEAAKRGVQVRLILDAGMHKTYPQPADSFAAISGIQVRTIDMRRIAGGVQHAKYFLIDGAAVYLGSQNLDWRSLKHIHELGVEIRDPSVTAVFQRVFDMDWAAAAPGAAVDTTAVPRTPAPPGRTPALPIRIVQAPGDTVALWPSYSPRVDIPDTNLWDRDAIVRLLDRARHEIVLQSLTYSPEGYGLTDPTLDQALRRAAARGVQVKLVISDWEAGTSAMRSLQSLTRVPNVEAKLSTVPEWSGGYIAFARVEHCKYAVVDSLWTWVGTSNWEPSYFLTTRNLAVTLENRPLALQARTIFENSWRAPGAAPVNPDSTYARKIRGETPPPGATKYGD